MKSTPQNPGIVNFLAWSTIIGLAALVFAAGFVVAAFAGG